MTEITSTQYRPITRRNISPELIEKRAQAMGTEDFNFDTADMFAHMIDNKCEKSEKSKKLVTLAASAIGFMISVFSFSKAVPKMRMAIGGKISELAGGMQGKIRPEISEVAHDATKEVAEEVAQKSSRVADFTYDVLESIKETADKIKIDTRAANVERTKTNQAIELADTAVACGISVLAGNEVGDVADEKQNQVTGKKLVNDAVKLVNLLEGTPIQ